MELTAAQTIAFLKRVSDIIREHRQQLTELDAAIGDADHGSNLDRGFTAVVARIDTGEYQDKDIGTILKTAGMTLISTVGGASGPLYGTAFMRAANVLADIYTADEDQIVTALEATLEGIKVRGKAQTGEKTMLDAITPGVAVLKEGAQDGEHTQDLYRRAVAAVEEGMQATIPMLATKGRASYLGERSIGHQDPGATSSYYIAHALYETLFGEVA